MEQTLQSAHDRLEQTIQRRVSLNERLIAALEHLPRERQISIIASWFSLDDLEKIVVFMEQRG